MIRQSLLTLTITLCIYAPVSASAHPPPAKSTSAEAATAKPAVAKQAVAEPTAAKRDTATKKDPAAKRGTAATPDSAETSPQAAGTLGTETAEQTAPDQEPIRPMPVPADDTQPHPEPMGTGFASGPIRGPAMTPYEQRILDHGRISAGAYIGGGLLGTWLGFGVGHAIQGRYDEGGLIFSAGEGVGLAMLMVGVIGNVGAGHAICSGAGVPAPRGGGGDGGFSCQTPARPNEDLFNWLAISGGVVYAVLRIWEIADLWSTPPRHNAEFERIRTKAGQRNWSFSLRPAVLPGGGMAIAGLRF